MNSVLRALLRFYSQAYHAVTDFGFYRTIYRQPIQRTLFFVLLLALHLAFMAFLYVSLVLMPRVRDFASWADDNAPPLLIEDGRLKVEADLPLTLRYPQDPYISLVFADDTNGGVPIYKPPALLLTPKALYLNDISGLEMPWAVLPQDHRRPFRFLPLLQAAEWPLFFLCSLAAFAVTVTLRPAEALVFSLFGYSAGFRFGRKWPYRCYFTIAVYALTAATAVQVMGWLLALSGWLFDLLYLFAGGIYVYQATMRTMAAETEGAEEA